MDDLQRRVGSGQVTLLVPDQSLPDGATGDRRFILNPTSSPALDEDVLELALEQAEAAGGRAAWLCASHDEANILQAILAGSGQAVYRLRAGDDDMVDAWSKVPAGHLVTAGRYDGLDLPGDICKLVIITTVPQASSEFERFVVAYLGDASYMRHRVGQRVTQALGRANRTPSDRSMYLGLDPMFAQILADPAVRASIPNGTQPTIRAALELYDEACAATVEACREFWRTPGHPTPAPQAAAAAAPRRRPRPGRAAGGSREVASASNEVSAATDLWVGDHVGAVRNARRPPSCLPGPGKLSTRHSGATSRPTHVTTGAGQTTWPLHGRRSSRPRPTGPVRHGFAGWPALLPTWREPRSEPTTQTGSSCPGTSGGARSVADSTPRCRLAGGN